MESQSKQLGNFMMPMARFRFTLTLTEEGRFDFDVQKCVAECNVFDSFKFHSFRLTG